MSGLSFFLAVLSVTFSLGNLIFFPLPAVPPSATPFFIAETSERKPAAGSKEQDAPSLESLLPRLQEIYVTRANALLTGADPEKIVPLYDQEARLGRWALSHEQTKIAYMQNWAKKRGVRIVEAKVNLDCKKRPPNSISGKPSSWATGTPMKKTG